MSGSCVSQPRCVSSGSLLASLITPATFFILKFIACDIYLLIQIPQNLPKRAVFYSCDSNLYTALNWQSVFSTKVSFLYLSTITIFKNMAFHFMTMENSCIFSRKPIHFIILFSVQVVEKSLKKTGCFPCTSAIFSPVHITA